MNIPLRTQAVLLLTAFFTKSRKEDPKPLTPTEWGRFAVWLHDQSLNPESLMEKELPHILLGWKDKRITVERLQFLLNRGAAMGIALEKWTRAGIWVLCRSDAGYPEKLKKHLKNNGPPLLFGCGNQRLLNQTSCAVVGSRKATEIDLNFARELGGLAAHNGISIISGGARGVDEASMMGTLAQEGTVIGVLAQGLLTAATSGKYRKYIMANNLVLVSSFYPEAGFYVGNAMARNKYIYCMAEGAVVVHSGRKGGTWNGALENLKKRWVPLWVKPTTDAEAGNGEIVSMGGNWLSNDIKTIDIDSLFTWPEQSQAQQELTGNKQPEEKQNNNLVSDMSNSTNVHDTSMVLYEFFLSQIKKYYDNRMIKPKEIQEDFALSKAQMDMWLKRAVKEQDRHRKHIAN